MTSKGISNTGFTLLENLIVLSMLTVSLSGVLSLTTSITRGNLSSKMMTIATNLAQNKMEDIKTSGYSGVTSITTTTEAYGTITDYTSYRMTTEISPDADANLDYETITVTIFWEDPFNEFNEKNVQLQTIIAK